MNKNKEYTEGKRLSNHICNYVLSGDTNECKGNLDGFKYSLEYLGMSKAGGWTIVRVTELYPVNNTIFIDHLKEALFCMIADLQVANQCLLDTPVVAWYFDKKTVYHDVRIRFVPDVEDTSTIEGESTLEVSPSLSVGVDTHKNM